MEDHRVDLVCPKRHVKWTTKAFSFRHRLSLAARKLARNLGVFNDCPGSGPRLYHQADRQKNQTFHHGITSTPEAVEL